MYFFRLHDWYTFLGALQSNYLVAWPHFSAIMAYWATICKLAYEQQFAYVLVSYHLHMGL